MQCKVRVIVSVCVPSGWCNSDSRAGPRTPGQSSRISTRHQRRGFARAGRMTRPEASARSNAERAFGFVCLQRTNTVRKMFLPFATTNDSFTFPPKRRLQFVPTPRSGPVSRPRPSPLFLVPYAFVLKSPSWTRHITRCQRWSPRCQRSNRILL